MTRAAWTSVLITVILLVTLSWTGAWLLEEAPPPPSTTRATPLPPIPLAERVATARATMGRWGRTFLSRTTLTDPRTQRKALLVLAGGASLTVLGVGLAVVRRRRRDRRPTPATHLGRWTSRTGLARDAARFLIARHHRHDLPVSGSAADRPEHARQG